MARGHRRRGWSSSTRSRWPPPRSRRSMPRFSRTAARWSSRCGGPGSSRRSTLDLALVSSRGRVPREAVRDGAAAALRALADELEVHLRAELDFVEEANNTELIAALARGLRRPRGAAGDPAARDRAAARARADPRASSSRRPRPGRRSGRGQLASDFFRAYIRQVTQGRRLPRRPTSRERAADRRRPARAAGLRTPRQARRETQRHWRCSCSRSAHNRSEDVAAVLLFALADDARLRRGGLRPEGCAASCPLSRRRGRDSLRRGAADLQRICSPSTRSACRRASRSSARRSPRPTRSRGRSIRRSTDRLIRTGVARADDSRRSSVALSPSKLYEQCSSRSRARSPGCRGGWRRIADRLETGHVRSTPSLLGSRTWELHAALASRTGWAPGADRGSAC